MLRLHVRSISHVTLAAYGAGCPAVMRQVSQSRRDILSQPAGVVSVQGAAHPSEARRSTQESIPRERNCLVCIFCEVRLSALL